MLDRSMLDADQRVGVQELVRHPKFLLDADMGVGKTVISLTAIQILFEYFKISSVLVVAPNMVSQTSWPTEIRNWSHLKGLSYTVLSGRTKAEIKNLVENDKADVTIIGTHLFDWLASEYLLVPPTPNKKDPSLKPTRHWKALSPNKRPYWRWDVLVFDEVQFFKSPTSSVSKSGQVAAAITPYVYGMTGTPMPNGEMDLWGIMALIDQGERLGRNISMYRKHFFQFDGYRKTYSLLPGAKETIAKAKSQVTHRIEAPARDYEVRRIVRRLPMSEKLQKQYNELEKEFLVEIENTDALLDESDLLNDLEEFEAVNSATLSGKLIQFATGTVYTQPAEEVVDEHGLVIQEAVPRKTVAMHDHKFEMLQEIVDATPEPVFILYWFQSDKERLKKRHPDAVFLSDVKDIAQTVKMWNEGRIRKLAANPLSAGHGLNLQYGGRIVIWLTIPWASDLWLQANTRLDRRGQTRDVLIYVLLTENSIDETVYNVVMHKVKAQDVLLNYIAGEVRQRLGLPPLSPA